MLKVKAEEPLVNSASSSGHARGSLLELETQADIAHELGLLSAKDFKTLQTLSSEVLGLIDGLCEYTERQQNKAHAVSST